MYVLYISSIRVISKRKDTNVNRIYALGLILTLLTEHIHVRVFEVGQKRSYRLKLLCNMYLKIFFFLIVASKYLCFKIFSN